MSDGRGLAAYRRLSPFLPLTGFVHFISFNHIMSVFGSVGADIAPIDGAASDFATRNIATTAGLAVGAGAVVAGAALLTAALPGHVIVAAGTTGALLYVGDRQYNDLPVIPGRGGAAAPATPAAETAAA